MTPAWLKASLTLSYGTSIIAQLRRQGSASRTAQWLRRCRQDLTHHWRQGLGCFVVGSVSAYVVLCVYAATMPQVKYVSVRSVLLVVCLGLLLLARQGRRRSRFWK